ncbi:Glutamyl-tRNA reductase [Arthrobacter sp. Bi83]|uniref:glutamyl-tRNA reductase n=1 Tax=Arthrobacter sp. Bi83 TaxID=2822353 RepID=UPI001DC55E9C|nr:glutamyl-tRNA reductase [Arthrobacter sp. Bi83]CAH0236834.1 Glutamyl-tRNA reductase [Arthrobacter sp. Bi83]
MSQSLEGPVGGRTAPDGRLFALVASHRGTGLDFLARLGSGPRRITPAAVVEPAHVAGAVVLSTCNRFEVYFEISSGTEPSAARRRVQSAISRCSGIPEEELAQSLDFLAGAALTEHLFSVGAGLDSAVVGEREIAGQLRRALTSAQESESASGALIRLFQAASRAARDVGALTTLGDAGRSMVSVALDLATARLAKSCPSGLSVVVIGTGAYAGTTLALLAAGKCAKVSVFSWSGRAEAFAAPRGAAALTRSQLTAALQGADVVIGCSGRGTRLGTEDFRLFRQGTNERLVVVDLALNRDFEPATGELPGIELITLDEVRLAAPREHSDGVRRAAELVRQAALRYEEERQARVMDPAIVALRGHMQQVLASEMARVKNQHGCTATAEAVEFALRRVVRQLLHVPTARARELAAAGRQDDYTAALEALYGLKVEPDDADRQEPVRIMPAAG